MFTTLSTSFSLLDEIVDVHLSGRKKGKGKKESGQRASLDGDDAIELACAVKQWQNNVRATRKIFHTPRLLSWESIIIIFPLSQISFYYSAEGKPIKKNTTRTHQICPLSSPRLRWSAAKCKAEKSRGKQHRTARKGFAAVCVLCVYLRMRAIIIRCNTYYSLITTCFEWRTITIAQSPRWVRNERDRNSFSDPSGQENELKIHK